MSAKTLSVCQIIIIAVRMKEKRNSEFTSVPESKKKEKKMCEIFINSSLYTHSSYYYYFFFDFEQ